MDFSKKLRALIIVIIIAAVFALSFMPAAMIYGKNKTDSPIVSTNKSDYSPEKTVIILGKNFKPKAVYTIVVIRPDGSIVVGDGSFVLGSDSVKTNKGGNFNYHYKLDGIEGKYIVNVVDSNGIIVASTSFTDATVRW